MYEIEFLQVRYFATFQEAYKQTMEFIEFYNTKRKHGSLKVMAPLDFKKCYKNDSIAEVEVRL
ncbi:MAG: transposase [Deltaproteobacteria bacterium]|nr:transposase [Deltaproteobacteria bacterium]